MNNPYLLNMDFNDAVTVLADEHAWVASPADGVSRIHLECNAPNVNGAAGQYPFY
jgi:hypothetical protein